MIKISKQNNSLIVEGIDNAFYPNNGDNSYPLNSLIVVTDNSDMATFRSVATNDVLFSGLIQNITINGEAVTKDNIIKKFDAVSNSSTGGGGGGSTVDAYTKEEADNKFASKDELTNVQTVANDADTKVDALTTRVEGVESEMNGKQDLLVSGTNIKTINNQSILGEGNIEISDYYTKTEADNKFATITEVHHQAADISALQTDMRGKQATLVSGENIKTINSQSILGSGDLTISGVSEEQAQEIAKIPTLETELAKKANVSDVPTVQTTHKGTNKKYIYSEGNIDNNNKTVVSNIVSVIDNTDTVKLGIYEWGGSMGKVIKLPSATTTLAGVMSAADKTKLDSVPETIPSQSEIDGIAANVSALEADMANKQPTLVSGTNIKTINNESLLGEGNIEVAKKTDIPSIDNLATKDELTAVETSLGNKQDILVSGTNIKTINSQSILGEGNIEITGGDVDLTNYYTKTETDTKLDTKQNTLVSGTNIKTINGESVLGEGNIVIEGSGITEEQAQEIAKIPTLETTLNNKQDTLVSGTNIKTVNSQSILGEGNLEVTIPDATTATSGAMSAADKTKLDSISNEWTGTQAEYDALTTKDNNIIYYVTE